MDPPEKKQDPPIAQIRESPEKGFPLGVRFARRLSNTQSRHRLVAPIGTEGAPGKTLFLLGGEAYCLGVTQDASLAKPPEQDLLEMLKGISPPKPRVEHTVGIDEIGLARPARNRTGDRAGILPQAVGDEGIESFHVLP